MVSPELWRRSIPRHCAAMTPLPRKAVLGSIFIDSGNYARVSPFLKTQHFYGEKNRWIFEAMTTLAERRNELDQVTVAHQIFEDGRLEEMGGMAYLNHLVMVTPTSLHCVHYAKIVHYCARAQRRHNYAI